MNDKLNEMEHSLQAKWADFEVKFRKNIDYQQQHRLTDLYKGDDHVSSSSSSVVGGGGGGGGSGGVGGGHHFGVGHNVDFATQAFDMLRPAKDISSGPMTKDGLGGSGSKTHATGNEKGLNSVLKQTRLPPLKFNAS